MILHIDKTLVVKVFRVLIPRLVTVWLYQIQFSRCDPAEKTQVLRMQPVGPDDMLALAQRYAGHLQFVLPMAAKRWARGDRAWMAFDKGSFVHLAWIRDVNLIDLQYELGDGAILGLTKPGVLIYDCWTPPEARGKGYYSRVLRCLVQQAKLPCWIYALKSNHASRRGIERAGFSPWAKLTRWRWGRRWGRWSLRFEGDAQYQKKEALE